MRTKTKRIYAILAATALTMGLSTTTSSAATTGTFNHTVPSSIKCYTKACNQAKEWYIDYYGFSLTFLARPLDATSLHNMRKMTAMATGTSAKAPGGEARLDAVDKLLIQANKSKTARACAAQALFFAGDQTRQNSAAVKDAQNAFELMKKIAKRQPTLKAYAKLGYEGTKTASDINQLRILQALQNNLRSCV